MGLFGWVALAEDMYDDDDDGGGLKDKKVADFLGVSQDEWEDTQHQANIDASNSGYLPERVERKNRQGKSWWD